MTRTEPSTVQRRLPGDGDMWVMVLGDMVIFAGYFVVFLIYRTMNEGEFLSAAQHLDITLGVANLSLCAAILTHEYPGVHIGAEAAIPGFTSIVPEYARASRQAIEMLLALGHKQIAILSGPFGSTDPAVIELNFGIRAAYDAIKTPIEAQNVVYGDSSFEHGVASTDILLVRPQKPTAIFCFSTLVAAGVLHRAQARGLSIPGDLSVVAFGDASFAPILHPPLTTVLISAEEIAAKALGDLETRIQDQDIALTRRLAVASAILERESCARPPGHV